jgi:tRNA(Ile)-lysidine synthase
LIDRNQFILVPQEKGQQESSITLSEPGVYQGFEGYLTLSEGDVSPPAIHDRNSIIVDAQAVRFPLCWRRWKPGDRFAPLGMHGKHKKIQDFLTDLRIDRLTKARVTVLEDADGKILWVVGYRLDDHFKMDAFQKMACLQLRYTPFEVQE